LAIEFYAAAFADERIVALNIAAHRAGMIFIGARPLQVARLLQPLIGHAFEVVQARR
jgi:hypothetical protein